MINDVGFNTARMVPCELEEKRSLLAKWVTIRGKTAKEVRSLGSFSKPQSVSFSPQFRYYDDSLMWAKLKSVQQELECIHPRRYSSGTHRRPTDCRTFSISGAVLTGIQEVT